MQLRPLCSKALPQHNSASTKQLRLDPMDAHHVSEGLSRLVARAADAYAFAKLDKRITESRLDIVAPAGAHNWVLAHIDQARADRGLSRETLVVVATGREAQETAEFLRAAHPRAEVLEFISWETLPHERLSPSPETVGRRLKTLHRLTQIAGSAAGKKAAHDHPIFVVTSVRAALQPVVADLADYPPLNLVTGHEYLLPELALKLVELAYQRVDMVTRRGEFAVRGGILDIFATTADHAVRLEFFGDELEQMREFSVADQRSLDGRPTELEIYAARELIITPTVAARAREMQHEFGNIAGMLEKIANGIPVEGMESLAPVLTNKLVQITDYLAEDSYVVMLSPEKSQARAQSLIDTNEEFLQAAWNAAVEGAKAPIDLSAGGFRQLSEFTAKLGKRSLYAITQFLGDDDMVDLGLYEIPNFKAIDANVNDFIADQQNNGQQVVIATTGHGTAERIVELLTAAKIQTTLADTIVEAMLDKDIAKPEVLVIQTPIRAGFASPEAKLIVLSESEFYGRGQNYTPAVRAKIAAKRGVAVDPLALKAGDYVVHEIHGIGRFVEMVQRQVGIGADKHMREYLRVEYAPSKRGQAADELFVPTDQLDLLTRYVGGEAPVLNKMGGGEWSRIKGNARKAVRKIAIDLVKLYSARVNAKGYAFGPDTAWQREMEDSFAYVETPDQLNAVEDIKRDMQSGAPMDRLIAGDVGYGKTEIAVRAAFKAVQDGKQVVMLVPTTLLVRQHAETFAERFKGFPVQVRALSRFQTAKESKDTLAGLATGAVDVVIGTHRLLSGNVKFRDLGLIIIDEEQRFGVEHKEKLKDLKMNVDVLSMSATPIPRTLEMAITGIREMSTLATPPEERHPILTYVGGYNEKQVVAAIHRELIREGQVFFVHNRVDTIDKAASRLAELVPEARIAVAHGQMNESQLEQVVIDFWERRYDVLVATTIIEAGIDIPNANTLIVDRAENFGLSQLHQIRGRVGRSRERAYAYFFYSPDKPLSPFAHDRLATIATNNELGSGMQVALKDLEIRGAGNLLGGEQSGHIAGVGFDLYLRMIGEAVDDFKGIKHESPAELKLELGVDAHIPVEYIDSERLRLEAYHKLSAASGAQGTRAQLDEILSELEDRYGPAPQSVKNLIDVTQLRQQCNRLGLKDVMMLGTAAKLTPVEMTESEQVRFSHTMPGSRYLHTSKMLTVALPKDSAGQPLRDRALIDWAWVLLAQVFHESVAN